MPVNVNVNFNIPKFPFYLPWFIYDLGNKQLITSVTIPGDIKDSKDVVLAENPIAGLNYQPVSYGGGGNRKLSFTLPLIKRNNTVGNVLLLKQVENLRNQSVGLGGVFSGQFNSNPQVLFNWGVGSVPLIWYVKKADATHKAGWTNAMGMPQYSEIEFELWLDESSWLYKSEEIFRKVSSLSGMVQGAWDVIDSQVNNKQVM